MEIKRSIDIEDVIRTALLDYMTAYCKPLPDDLTAPSIEVTQVGGIQQDDEVDTFDIVLNSRAELEEEALLYLRTAVGVLKEVAKAQTSDIRYVKVNSSASWGADPARPDLAMCTARLQVLAHLEKTTI